MNKIQVGCVFVDLVYEMIRNKSRLNDDFDNNYRVCQDISNNVINYSKMRLDVLGDENIPKNGNVLIASNHRSFFDIFILMASINRPSSFVVAEELCSYPFLRKYIESINCVSVDRKTEDISKVKEQLQNISDGLKRGSLILFPEGECNYFSDEVKEFKKGGFMGVKAADSIIVPTYINVDKIKNIGRFVVPVDGVVVKFGKAYRLCDISDKKMRPSEIAEYAREKVLELKK